MGKKQPKFDRVIRDVLVRVYASRTKYEVLFGSAREIGDPEAYVLVYPKLGTPEESHFPEAEAVRRAAQGRLEYRGLVPNV